MAAKSVQVASAAYAQSFREAQAASAQDTADSIGQLWDQRFSIPQARSSWAGMRPQILTLIRGRQLGTIVAATRFYNARRLLAGFATIRPAVTPPDDAAHIGAVIDSTGLGMFLHMVKGGAQMADAAASGRAALCGAVQRLVMQGGRDAVLAASKADPDSTGIRRVTGGTCDYCENLAAEGVTVDQEFPAHDSCECTADPAFGGESQSAEPPPDEEAPAEAEAPPEEAAAETDTATQPDWMSRQDEAVTGPLGDSVEGAPGHMALNQSVNYGVNQISDVWQNQLSIGGIKVSVVDQMDTTGIPVKAGQFNFAGVYSFKTGSVQISSGLSADGAEKTTVHELSHAIDGLGSAFKSESAEWKTLTADIRKDCWIKAYWRPASGSGNDVANIARSDREMFAELAMQRQLGLPYDLTNNNPEYTQLFKPFYNRLDQFFERYGINGK